MFGSVIEGLLFYGSNFGLGSSSSDSGSAISLSRTFFDVSS